MNDAEVISSAREAELRALFVQLHRGIEDKDPLAPKNFLEGLRVLAEADAVALKAIDEATIKA